MQLKKIQIENLRSYETQEIEFPKGSTLLSGDIGAGKTTILLAIEFALFGLQPGQRASSLLRTNKDSGKVILDFVVNNENVTIERTLKRGKKSITQDSASITINNEKFEASVTEVKNKILKILNYPEEFAKKTNILYKFTVYTPQEEMKQIIIEPAETRLNILRHVFGIDKYKRIQENTSILTLKLREKIRINQALISELESDKRELIQKQENIILLKQNKEQAVKEHENSIFLRQLKEKEIEEIQEKINQKKILENENSKSDVLIREKSQQIKTLQSAEDSLNLQIQEAKKISFSQEEYNSIEGRIQFQQNKEDEFQREYIKIISRINSEQSKKSETENLKNKIKGLEKCPTCLQEVSEQYKKNISQKTDEEIQMVSKSLSELNLKKSKFEEQINSVKKIISEFKKRKSELELLKIKTENFMEKEQRILEIKKQIDFLKKDLEILNMHVISIQDSIQEFKKYDAVFLQKNRELQELKHIESQKAIKNAEINKEIQFSEKIVEEMKEKIKEKEFLKSQTENLKGLEDWLSNKFLDIILFTEKQVMITLRQEFSKLFSEWFSILVSDSLTAKLGDDFEPIIEQQDYELDYSFLSGGERTAIALAYRLSLNQVINSIMSNLKTNNLVILDEPTEGFSTQQLDKMRDVLNQLNAEQLILVSHEPKMESFVDNIIRVKKESGITRINS